VMQVALLLRHPEQWVAGHCQVNGVWVAFDVPLCWTGGSTLGRFRTNPWPRQATRTSPA
jgi:hypothetical protein